MESSGTGASGPPELAPMIALLKDMGVEEHEPRVANMLLDYAYRYVTDILLDAEVRDVPVTTAIAGLYHTLNDLAVLDSDSQVYSMHTGRPAGCVDLEDVRLAVQARSCHSFVDTPSQVSFFDASIFILRLATATDNTASIALRFIDK